MSTLGKRWAGTKARPVNDQRGLHMRGRPKAPETIEKLRRKLRGNTNAKQTPNNIGIESIATPDYTIKDTPSFNRFS